MSKSVPINEISAIEDDEQTIQDVLQSLDVEVDSGLTQQNNDIDYQQQNKQSANIANSISDNTVPYPHMMSPPPMLEPTSSAFSISKLNDDIINIAIVFIIFIIVSKIPVENFIYRYISIQHVPLSQVLIKATIAAILFFIIKKVLNIF